MRRLIVLMAAMMMSGVVGAGTGGIRYINTLSSGGDGTTNATSGATAAYASQAAMIAGEAGILSQPLIVYCSGASSDTSNGNYTGFTTSTGNYIDIIGDWNGRKYDVAKYHIAPPTGSCVAIGANCNHIRFEHIQLSIQGDTDGEHCVDLQNNGGPIEYYFIGNYMRRNLQNRGDQSCISASNGVYDSASSKIYIYNNIFTRGNCGVEIQAANNSAAPSIFVYSNSFMSMGGAGNGYGITRNSTGGTWDVRNNLFYLSKTEDVNGNDPETADYNSTTLSSLGYTANTHDRVSQTFTFASLTETADGFAHITADDAGAKGWGVDLSSIFTTDIDGLTRTVPWDIGINCILSAIGSIADTHHVYFGE